jgi:hypothetical protein
MGLGRSLVRLVLVFLVLLVIFASGWVAGRLGMGSVVAPASLTGLERAFSEQMAGAALVGQFTVAGREEPGRPDRYEIESVEKVGEDRWRFNARLRPGGPVLPIVVPMRWVGDTPVIVMTDFSIPAVGTFSTRVFFYGDRYAGTWQNARVGGHMFGRIERAGGAGRAGEAGATVEEGGVGR